MNADKYSFDEEIKYPIFDAHVHLIDLHNQYFTFTPEEIEQYMTNISSEGILLTNVVGNPAEEADPILSDGIALARRFFAMQEFSKPNIKRYLWLHPNEFSNAIIEELRPDGIKYHPSLSQVSIDQTEVLDYCQEYKLPLLIHCGRNEKSRIDYLLDLAPRYDDFPIIVGHMGGLATPLVIRSLKMLEHQGVPNNFYVETSGGHNPRILQWTAKVWGEEKVLFGTDLPFFDPYILLTALYRAFGENQVLYDILSNNIKRMFSQYEGRS